MKDFLAKTVVITGAGSGIGRSLALKLATKGAFLALSDIDEEGLAETKSLALKKGGKVIADKLDVADKDAVYAYAEKVNKTLGGVDIVINNAGVAVNELAENIKYDDFEWIMGINFWGVVYGTKAFLPFLKKAPEAYIINISSIFGIIGFPCMSAYNASKFAVKGFTESLRYELEDTSVTPVCVHPGGIDTNIVKNARFYTSSLDGSNHQQDRDSKLFHKVAQTTPDQAADTIINGVLKGNKRVLIGNDAKALDVAQRLLPQSYDRIVQFMMKSPLARFAR